MTDKLFWMSEDELRDACRILATRLCQTETRMVMMAIEMQRAVEYGYRVGYEDGITGESYSVSTRDMESLILH